METKDIQCIGFIMDGNRRWAKARGLSSLEGHQKGYEAFQSVVRAVHDAQIPHMVCYAFSTENWKRDESEVSYLMKLLERALSELTSTYKAEKRSIRIRIIGEVSRLPRSLQEKIASTEEENKDNAELTVWIALSYGGRAEIIQAVNRAVDAKEHVTEQTFEKFLWTEGMPDPDLIIRTSGEIRTSNFLIWQSAYSEYFFTETLWPDFGENELQSILGEYKKRQRRKGA